MVIFTHYQIYLFYMQFSMISKARDFQYITYKNKSKVRVSYSIFIVARVYIDNFTGLFKK